MEPTPRTPVVEQCLTAKIELLHDPAHPKEKDKFISEKVPCTRIEVVNEVQFCTTYADPDKKWRARACPFAQQILTKEQEFKINPLKASKRAAAGK